MNSRKRTPLWFIIGIVASVLIVVVLGVLTMMATGKIEGQGGVNQQAIAAVVTAHTEHTVITVTQPSQQTASLPDLSYPNATKLDFNDKIQWPQGRPNSLKNNEFGGFATDDSYSNVVNYYRAKLPTIGYKLTENNCSDAPECDPNVATYLYGKGTTSSVEVNILSPNGLKIVDPTGFPQQLINQVKTNQTLISWEIDPNP